MGKRTKKRKARSFDVTLDFGEPVHASAISFDPNTGRVALLDGDKELRPVSAQVRATYARSKGEKVVTSISVTPDSMILNPNGALERYASMFGVDTNTLATSTGVVSFTGVVGGFHVQPTPTSRAVGCRDLWCLEFHEVIGKPENHGWMEAIRAIADAPWYDARVSYALVVDSDLGLHPRYNVRELPIYGDFFLPRNWTLIYASSHTGVGEFVANALLSRAHKLADKIRELAAATNDGLTECEGANYTRGRYWRK